MHTDNPYELLYMSHLGDDTAFEALFQKVMGILGRPVSVNVDGYQPLYPYKEDIFQESSLVVITAINGYRDDMDTQFATYFTVIARRRVWNVCKSYTRKFLKFGEMISLDGQLLDDESLYDAIPQRNPMNEPEYVLGYQIAEENLARVLAEMTEEELDAVEAWILNEPYEEGARRRGINPKTWDGRRLRTRKKIREAVLG